MSTFSGNTIHPTNAVAAYPQEKAIEVDYAAIAITNKIYLDALDKAIKDVFSYHEVESLLNTHASYPDSFATLASQLLGMIQLSNIINQRDLDEHAKTQK